MNVDRALVVAIQLGYLPRAHVEHTSGLTEGQIYIGSVSWALGITSIALVLWLRQSSRLAAAYGVAVTGTMAITSITYFVVTRQTWGWPLARSLSLLLLFLSFDIPLFGANLTKLFQGGYVPLVVAVVIFSLMSTWRRGRVLLARRLHELAAPSQAWFEQLVVACERRVRGTAVVLAATPVGVPPSLVHHAKHAGVLHETVVLLTVVTEHVPRVSRETRVEVHELGHGFHRVLVHTGFMETPDLPRVIARVARERALPIDFERLTYYVGRERLLATDAGEMKALRERLFAFMSRNAASPDVFYRLPPEQVVEIGLRVDL